MDVASMPKWLDDVFCTGYEKDLSECHIGQRPGSKGHNCGHDEDIVITCRDRMLPGRYDYSRENIVRNGKQRVNSSASSTEKYLMAPIDGNLDTKSFLQISKPRNSNAWYYVDFGAPYSLTEIRLWFHDLPSG